MIRLCYEQWNKNKELLMQEIAKSDIESLSYENILSMIVEHILNRDREGVSFDKEKIHVIDDGDYQGTIIFLIPFYSYQPSESEYLMAYCGYGSCSGCDALLYIQDCYNDRESQEKGVLNICKDIVASIIKPYNYGWRHDDLFETVEYTEN